MNVNYYVLIMIALCGLSAAVSAAPRWEVDAAQLPPGMTKEKAVKMLDDIDKVTAKEREQEEAADRRRADRVQKAAKKYEDRFAKAIEKDPELLALQTRLEAGTEALKNPDLSDEERNARLERMAPDLNNFRQKGLAKAGIDVQAMNAEIGSALNEGVTTRGVDGENGSERLQEQNGAFYYVAPDDAALPTDADVESRSLKSSMLATSTTTVKYLGDPWANVEKSISIGDPYRSVADRAAGTYTVFADAGVAGTGTNRMGLAHFLTVPSGISRIRVSAQIPQADFHNLVLGFVLGGGQTKTSSTIEVWDGSSRRLCRSYRLHADVWGFIAAIFNKSGLDNTVLDCEFTAPAAGRDVVLKFVSAVFVQAWGFAGAQGTVRGQPANAKVTLYK